MTNDIAAKMWKKPKGTFNSGILGIEFPSISGRSTEGGIMKKTVSMIVAGALLVTLGACSKKAEPTVTTEATEEATDVATAMATDSSEAAPEASAS